MLEFKSIVVEKLFLFWIRACQVLGLVLVEFDKKKDGFVFWKFSSIYCAIVGIFVTVLYPVILIRFQREMDLSFSAFSFTIFISTTSYFFYLVFMSLSYLKQYKNRHELLNVLNNLAYFYRTSKKTYREFDTDCRLRRYQKLFFLSILVKLGVFASEFITYFCLSLDEMTLWYSFLSFPFIVAMAICNQYFLGILIIEYFVSTINLKLAAATHLVSISSTYSMSKQIDLDLEKISIIHTNLYELLNSLSSFFGYQMMFSIFCNFLKIAITGFQIFSALLMLFMSVPISWDFENLMKIEIVGIFFVAFDIFMHLKVCVRCSDEDDKIVEKLNVLGNLRKLDNKTINQIKCLILQMKQEKVSVSVGKAFTLHHPLLYEMISSMFSYLIVLIQFQIGDIIQGHA